MLELIQYFSKGDDYQNVLTAYRNGIKEQLIAGLNHSARTLFIASLFQDEPTSQFIVTHNLHQAQKLYDDLVEWVGEEHVYLYPVNELISSEIATASPELRGQRIQVLNQLMEGKRKIVIAPLAGVRRFLPPVEVWKKAQHQFTVGQDIHIEEMQTTLLYLGYERVEMIESQGEYSIRGGIIDIFPATEENPIRIELFDTEVESIRYFDIGTQRSVQSLPKVTIGPQ